MARPSRLGLALELGLAGAAACLAAVGASTALDLATDAAPPRIVPEALPAPLVLPPLEQFAAIAERDPFGGVADERDALPLRLWGVAIHGGESRAVLEDTTTRRQDLYRIGDEVGGARITAIGWDHVTVASAGRETTLAMAAPAARPAPAPTVTAGAVPARPADGGIRRVGTTAFLVDRREVEDLAGNASALSTQLRAVAELRDGRAAGFRLFKIQDGSVFARLGLENGDVVERVNGAPVTDPTNLLGFLDRLRTEPRVALDVVRAGERRTLVYDLR